jgi:proteasome accessory factor B
VDKLERLLNLISALLATSRPLTAEELRVRVPGYPESKVSFRRAFERDKEDLREMGIPLVLEALEGVDPPVEGYRIDRRRYYLDDPGLEPDELSALHLAATAVRLDGIDSSDGWWKLGGVAAGSDAEPDASDAFASLPTDPSLAPLYQACAERRQARFVYNDNPRTIDPHRLGYQRGHWYLTGYDHDRAAERNFRLDRIAGSVEVGPPGAFEPRDDARSGLPGDPWRLGGGPEVVARLLVDADQVTWASQQLGEDAIVEGRPDGAAVFEVSVTNWPAFRTFVLGFLDHAELLGPPELRNDLTGWLEVMAR